MLREKFAMTDLGDVSQILSIAVESDKAAGTIELSLGQYTLSALERSTRVTATRYTYRE